MSSRNAEADPHEKQFYSASLADVYEKQYLPRYACLRDKCISERGCTLAKGSLKGTSSLFAASLRVLCISLARQMHFETWLCSSNGPLEQYQFPLDCISSGNAEADPHEKQFYRASLADVYEKQYLPRCACLRDTCISDLRFMMDPGRR